MTGTCEICGAYGFCHVHHVLNGYGNRRKADKYGLIISVCPRCHDSIHRNPEEYRYLKQEAQRKVMQEQGWTVSDFIREFGKNYL